MASYSTYTDFYSAYGKDTVRRWLSDGIPGAEFEDIDDIPGVNTKVTWFLEKAFGKINSYLSTRYSLPITEAHDDLKECEMALAAYRMTNKANAIQSDKIKNSYTEAIDWLKGIAKGEINLGYTTTAQAFASGNDFQAEERQFTHGSLTGLGL